MLRNFVITYRRFLVVVVHAALWTFALAASFLLRFEFTIPAAYRALGLKLVLLTLGMRSLVHWRLGLFHGLWRYSGARDLISLFKGAVISSFLIATIWAFLATGTFPRSILILDFAFSILVVGGVRFGIRTIREVVLQSMRSTPARGESRRRRILVLGAGDAGEMLMREIVRIYGHRYDPVGFLDDASHKQNERIHGLPVLGPISDVVPICARERIDEIILAIPSMTGTQIRQIVGLCRPTGASLRTLPAVDSLIDGRVTVSQLADVAIEDLLGREPVTLDTEAIEDFIRGRVILVTGAGGSIGSELCKQICRFGPRTLLLVEQAENNLFEVHRALIAEHREVSIIPCVADICDSRRLETIFERERPAVVFHAAAHKHVPMMESNPGEAIKNNVFGTKKVADAAHRFGVEKFVMVSTDKAVNPTSVMGVSKRVAELYIQALSQTSRTHFIAVRFGNVLGSAGSVIPIFKEQIKAGGPVTVTHPEMRRYFMTIPEACQLILQAGTMGRGGEIFILDMGEPVKIVDLARDLIRLSGFEVDDVPIVFSGVRPGEKLFEELSFDAEKAEKTGHPKIFVGMLGFTPLAELEHGLVRLHTLTDGSAPERIRTELKRLVPEYSPELNSDRPPPASSSKAVVIRAEESDAPTLVTTETPAL
ncbi:MAG: polysaccharide biosynthesis protein [Labilithrix sp.]|nr:polysaccharide biosynthesis protein [Labilithrix sp.]MCW5814716.1 polysaccharide biosynthesis protein [Labilithrix sp.]